MYIRIVLLLKDSSIFSQLEYLVQLFIGDTINIKKNPICKIVYCKDDKLYKIYLIRVLNTFTAYIYIYIYIF